MRKLTLVSVSILLFSIPSMAEIKTTIPFGKYGTTVRAGDKTDCAISSVQMKAGGNVIVMVDKCTRVVDPLAVIFTGRDAPVGAALVNQIGIKTVVKFESVIDDPRDERVFRVSLFAR